MCKKYFSISLGCCSLLALLWSALPAWGGSDVYVGDTAIYSGDSENLRPNILFLIDNSPGMAQGGSSNEFNPATDYTPTGGGGYVKNAVYERSAATAGTINYTAFYGTTTGIDSVACLDAKNLLVSTGFYAGPLKKQDGSCNASQPGSYYLGNFLNYTTAALAEQYPDWAPNTSYSSGSRISVTLANNNVVTFEAFSKLPPNTDGIVPPAPSGTVRPNFDAASYCATIPVACVDLKTAAERNACAGAYQSSPKIGCGDPPYLTGLPDGTDLEWRVTQNLMNMIQGVLKTVISGARQTARFGVMTFGSNNKGGQLRAQITDVDADDLDGSTGMVDTSPQDYNTLLAAVSSLDQNMLSSNNQPVNELFYDVGQYFLGKGAYFGNTPSVVDPITGIVGLPKKPMQYSCQNNYVFLLTTGATSNADPGYGDLNGDRNVGYSDDGAKYLYDRLETFSPYNDEIDLPGTTDQWPGKQRINTTVVQVMTPRVPELENTARLGHGLVSDFADPTAPGYVPGYYHANNSGELARALLGMVNTAINESNTSFVAPVVPTSPENRTYSGERIYLGFFQPIREQPWRGNLKKYGFNQQGQVIDQNLTPATDDRSGAFLPTAKSHWSPGVDGSTVQLGGVGQVLADRDLTAKPRKLYTNRGANLPDDLTLSTNEFTAANVSSASLFLNDAGRASLISYLQGYDAYDDDADGDLTEKRTWLMGDVLHSKPQLVNYNRYDFNDDNEKLCDVNKTIIYVGTNDGMFHAFRDCDGEELWAFIPNFQLGTLNKLGARPARHANYNDSSTTVYIYDADNDGNIGVNEDALADGDPNSGANDKVLLVLAARRGGDYILILDVTNPERPILMNTFSRYLWGSINQLKESWSEPKIGKIKYAPPGSTVTETKLALFFGGGYDNLNEDTRFGSTMLYTGVSPVTNTFFTTPDSGLRTSLGTIPAFTLNNFEKNAVLANIGTGRGVYAVDLATINDQGVPSITEGRRLLWSKTFNATDPDLKFMTYSFPSDLALADTNYDDYIDRIYAGDAGGQLWRFSGWDTTTASPTANPTVSTWAAKRIFVAGLEGTVTADLPVNPNTRGGKIFYRPSITFESNGVFALYFGTGDREHPLNTKVVDRFYAVYDRGQSSTVNKRATSESNPALVNIGAIDESELVNVTDNALQNSDGTGNAALLTELYSSRNYGWYIDLDYNSRVGEKILAPPLVLNKVAYFTTYTPNATVSVDPCSPGNLGVSRAYAVNYKTGEAVLNFNIGNDTTPAPNERGLGAKGEVLLRADREMTVGVGIPSGLVSRMPANGDVQVYIGGGGGLKTMEPVQGGTIIPVYWLKW